MTEGTTHKQTTQKRMEHATLPSDGASSSVAVSSNPVNSNRSSASHGKAQDASYALLPIFLLALAVLILAYACSLTHFYPSALSLLSLKPISSSYSSPQTCEMSFFYLSHRQIPIQQLSPASQALLQGRIAFNSTRDVASLKPLKAQKRRTAEFDDEEDDVDEVESSSSASTTIQSSQTDAASAIFENDYHTFEQIFLRSLPHAFSGSNTKYKLYQYLEHDHYGRHEKYPRSRHGTKAEQRTLPNDAPRIPIFFIHGNSGSYHQVRSIASRLTTTYLTDRENYLKAHPNLSAKEREKLNKLSPDLNDYYAVDFFEESPAFSGAILWQQAWFLNEALHTVLAHYEPSTKVIIVAHSMGGVLARIMPHLANAPVDGQGRSRIQMIASLGSPQRAPVVQVDELMQRLYSAINTPPVANRAAAAHQLSASEIAERVKNMDDSFPPSLIRSPFAHLLPLVNFSRSLHAEQVFMVSVAGGERDFQVEPALTDLSGIYHEHGVNTPRTLSILSHSIQYSALSESGSNGAFAAAGIPSDRLESIDHQCMCWCKQLMEVLAYSIRDFSRNALSQHLNITKQSFTQLVEKQKKLWIPNAVHALNSIATNAKPVPEGTTPPSTQKSLALYVEQFKTQSNQAVAQVKLDVASIKSASIVFVWSHQMSHVELCSGASGTTCVSLTDQVEVLAPQMHPEHADMTAAERETKRVGITSTYLVHITSQQLEAALKSAGAVDIVLQFTLASSAYEFLSKLRPLRGGWMRQIGVGVVFSADASFPLLSSLHAGVKSAPGLYLIQSQQSRGIDEHYDLQFSLPSIGDNEHGPPAVVALFTAAARVNSINQHASASFVNQQLFTFYARNQRSSHHRIVHSYRAGVDRTLTGLVMVLSQTPAKIGSTTTDSTNANPDMEREWRTQQHIEVGDALNINYSFTLFGVVSFLKNLYLQFSIFPQFIVGTTLIVFAIQHECVRRVGNFPRPAQLLTGVASTLGNLNMVIRTIVVAGFYLWLLACFVVFFKGNLASDPLLVSRFQSLDFSDLNQVHSPAAIMWNGWSISVDAFFSIDAAQLSVIGSIYFLASLTLVCVIESIVYYGLFVGHMVFNGIKYVISFPFVKLCCRNPASPQLRYFTTFYRRLFAIVWILHLMLFSLFTTTVTLYALKYFAGLDLLSWFYFFGQQLTAWASTLGMIFGLLENHFYFQQDIVSWFQRNLLIAHPFLNNMILIIACILIIAITLQVVTFPNLKSNSNYERKKAVSLAAYKSSLLTVLLILVLLFILPQLLSSFRLDVSRIDAQWSHVYNMAGASGDQSDFMFYPAQSPKTFHALATIRDMIAARSTLGHEIAERFQSSSTNTVTIFPFLLSWELSFTNPLVFVALIWSTLLSWCMFHVPFSPPILQPICLGVYGLSLLFVHASNIGGNGLPVASMWWIGIMCSLCMLPHAMANGMYIIQVLLDYVEGKEGEYDRQLERERIALSQPTPQESEAKQESKKKR